MTPYLARIDFLGERVALHDAEVAARTAPQPELAEVVGLLERVGYRVTLEPAA